jgi:hypothetical protein
VKTVKDRTPLLAFAALLLGFTASSCSGAATQAGLEPAVTTTVNPATQTTLQFAVGSAVIAGKPGLNTLETLRQNSGPNVGTSVLANAPTILGPAGFSVPAAPDAYADAGGASIVGTIQTSITSAPAPTTFNPSSGSAFIASSYGFLPSAVNNSNVVPNLVPSAMPFYAANNPVLSGTGLTYVGGPPAFVPPGHTSAQDGQFPNGYKGYTLGFADFQATPVSGTYTLSVVVPTGINATTGQSSFATLTAKSALGATALPAWTTAPAFVPDGTGGGTITANFGAGGAVTEEYLELVDTGPADCQLAGTAPYYYTFKVSPGQATVMVPDKIGSAPPGTAQPHTLCTSAENTTIAGTSTPGDSYLVYGFAVDYPLFNSAFPQSTGQAAPVIAGASGQADLTSSAATTGTGP